jgi:hypothetical protein
VIGLLFVTIPRSVFGAIKNVTSDITGIIECNGVNACIYYIT